MFLDVFQFSESENVTKKFSKACLGCIIMYNVVSWRFRIPSHCRLLTHSSVWTNQQFCRIDYMINFFNSIVSTRLVIWLQVLFSDNPTAGMARLFLHSSFTSDRASSKSWEPKRSNGCNISLNIIRYPLVLHYMLTESQWVLQAVNHAAYIIQHVLYLWSFTRLWSSGIPVICSQ